MNKKINQLFISICLFIYSFGCTQTIHIELDSLSVLDEDATHITLFKQKPEMDLIIPPIDTTNSKFFDVFYTRSTKNDPLIDIMLMQREKFDELYVDSNNDEDLSNDGPPIIFNLNKEFISFFITDADDEKQKVKLILQRKPRMPTPGAADRFVDKDGNLTKQWAKTYGAMIGNFDFKGEKGTFYFDDRETLRRGNVKIDQKSIMIGVFDYTNNGLYTDKEDLLLIDLNGDGRLAHSSEHELFKLNEVFSINKENYKLTSIDKYGTWIEIIKTSEKPKFTYLKEYQKAVAEQTVKFSQTGEIDQSFWEMNFSTLENENIRINDFKGKLLLLNFWGEWCKPCVIEIPDLVQIKTKLLNAQIQMLSFLKSNNISRAQEMIKEKKMNWPQVHLSKELESHFKIKSYPTNILIFPDGKGFVQTGQINIEFVKNIIENL